MTIEDLALQIDAKIDHVAEMVAKGFDQQDQKIEKFYQEFTEFKEETVERFENIDENFGKIRRDLLNLDDRFITLPQFERFIEKNVLN